MNSQHTQRVSKHLERSHVSVVENAGGEDRLLVEKSKSGDASAFGTLFERHRCKIHCITFRILRNQQDAEDAVQKAFQRAFTNLKRFREDSTFLTWMTRIAINEALMLLRQRRPNRALSEEHGDGTGANSFLELPDDRLTPEQALAQTELRSAVIHAISKLRHNLRIVVLLREVHGFTSAEIARRLGLTVAAVKGRTFHARRHLRRHLNHKFQGTDGSLLIGSRD